MRIGYSIHTWYTAVMTSPTYFVGKVIVVVLEDLIFLNLILSVGYGFLQNAQKTSYLCLIHATDCFLHVHRP